MRQMIQWQRHQLDYNIANDLHIIVQLMPLPLYHLPHSSPEWLIYLLDARFVIQVIWEKRSLRGHCCRCCPLGLLNYVHNKVIISRPAISSLLSHLAPSSHTADSASADCCACLQIIFAYLRTYN